MNSDGRVIIADAGRAFAYISQSDENLDEYLLQCANDNGGSLYIGGVGKL